MKIRNGFVSNSSSSSFVIGIKGGELTKEKLTEVIGVPESPILSELGNKIVDFIMDAAEKETVESILYNYCYKTLDDAVADNIMPAKYINDGWSVYTFSASYNETGDPIELMFGNGAISDIETDTFILNGWN